ncbi:tyrosine-type recombinase/integrase [Vibrio alginolyticus]|uniref:tyrosine-type recombinase/integrase n=1 Tax=Vibrio alginolyticus TaxID=663 RepID=UPI00215BCF24|nr:site-specific integrase [Vibrio alginolyticus]MCR9520685.1 tyrosine-type recombinase/integrase [Vibrio alginolyticus]MCS0168061.1 tyrosine-type recombinase/integrase [Vibrio alginolyticus]
MAKKNLLTALKVEKTSCSPNEKSCRLYDGGGLSLVIYPSQHKAWHMRIKKLNGKETLLTFGSLDSISLSEARELRETLLSARLQGKEPKHVLDKLRRNNKLTVAELMLAFLDEKRTTWKESTFKGEFNRAKKYLIDSPFGSIPADALTVQHIYDFAQNMDKQGYKSQHKKVISLLQRAYDLGSIKYELDTIDVSKITQFLKKHKRDPHACIELEDLPAVNALIAESNCSLQIKLLWDFLFLTSQRVQEATQNTWNNVNFDDMTITIPSVLSKNGLENIIPMSPQAHRVLKLAKVISNGSPYIFPSPRVSLNQPISKDALGKLLRNKGLKGTMSAHGIRSIFSSEMHEELDITESLFIEMILSHTDKDRVREIYNRSKFISKRRDVLDLWGNMYEEITKDCSCTDAVENELIRLKLLPS